MSYETNEQVLEVVDFAIYSRKGWFRVNCPFCLLNTGKDDKRRSLGIHVEGRWHCFRCEEWGSLDEDLPDWIGEKAHSPGTEADEDGDEVTFDPPEGFYPLWCEPGLSARTFAQARAYLRRRGLGPDVWHYAGA